MKEKKVRTEEINAPSAEQNVAKKRFTKKHAVITAIISACLVVCLTVGLCLYFFVFNKGTNYYTYFNNFTSKNFTSATATLNLSDDVYVASYDATDDVFITARDYTASGSNSTVTYYGLASYEKEYTQPVYKSILQINGDYAIVVRIGYSGEESSSGFLDVIRFRGGTAPYSLMTNVSQVYVDGTQMTFCEDYIACYQEIGSATATQPSYATFYDYKSGAELLETFKIRQGYDSNAGEKYSYAIYDGYLVANSKDRAYFYDTNAPLANGYLEPAREGEYVPFSSFDDDTLSSFIRELDVYYVGNGWFASCAKLSKTSAFDGYRIILTDSFGEAYYVHAKTEFYNVKTGRKSTNLEIFCLAGIANKYTKEYYTTQEQYLTTLNNYDTTTGTYEYNLPFANPSQMVKDGYSIVYYYFLPYVGDDSLGDYQYQGMTTFCIVDENLAMVQPEEVLMPLAYIDGVGITTSDPIFDENTGTAYVYDKYLNSTVMATFEQGKATYIPYYANKEGCIVYGTFSQGDDTVQYYGAVTPDGKRITDFKYQELTYFSGGYAIGSVVDGDVKTYYRIDGKGEETEISGIYLILQGVYIYQEDGKVGLKNYAGEVLIEPTDGTINVSNVAMQDGKAIKSYAVVTIGQSVKIYKID